LQGFFPFCCHFQLVPSIKGQQQVNSLLQNVSFSVKRSSWQAYITAGLPKTTTGIRKISITERVLALLADYKIDEENRFLLINAAFLFHSDTSPLFPRDPTYITKQMTGKAFDFA